MTVHPDPETAVLTSLKIKSLLRRQEQQANPPTGSQPSLPHTPKKRFRTARGDNLLSPKKPRQPISPSKLGNTPFSPSGTGSLFSPQAYFSKKKAGREFFSTKRKSLVEDVLASLRDREFLGKEKQNGATPVRVELSPATVFPQRLDQRKEKLKQAESKKLITRLREIEQVLKTSHYNGESPKTKPTNFMQGSPFVGRVDVAEQNSASASF